MAEATSLDYDHLLAISIEYIDLANEKAIEKGYIIFIGSTTENPFVSMTRAIVSRCRVFEFKPFKVVIPFPKSIEYEFQPFVIKRTPLCS